MTTKQLTAR